MNVPLYTSCVLSAECFANRCSFCLDPNCRDDCHDEQEWTGTHWQSSYIDIDWWDSEN